MLNDGPNPFHIFLGSSFIGAQAAQDFNLRGYAILKQFSYSTLFDSAFFPRHSFGYVTFKCLLILAVIIAAWILSTGTAWAWGPGVHLFSGSTVLTHLNWLDPALATLLSRHREAFLYGCLSADIFIGKGSKPKPLHSHNWSTGDQLLEDASSPEISAYAYGYLTHLAADIIAHNCYVPTLLRSTRGRGKLAHVYIELMADTKVPWSTAQSGNLFNLRLNPADVTLVSTLENNRLGFAFKKQLYKSGLKLWKNQTWQTSMAFMDRTWPLENNETFLEDMLRLSLAATFDILKDPKHPSLRQLDPIGSRELNDIRLSPRPHKGLRSKLNMKGLISPWKYLRSNRWPRSS